MRRALALVLLWSSPAWAGATVDSSGQWYATIGEALGAASAGDLVTVEAGTYSESLVIAADVTLVGAGMDETSIVGDGLSRAVDITSAAVTIQGIEVDGNGQTTVAALGGSLTLDAVRMLGGSTGGWGGNLSLEGTSTLVTGSVVTGGSASIAGGAIAARSSTTLDLVDTVIAGGTAPDGGGIYATGSTVTCDGCTLSGASATTSGGAIALASASTLVMTDSFASGPSASGSGGFLWLDASSGATLRRTTVCGADALVGAGIYAEGEVDVANSVFAYSTGGAAIEFDDTAGNGSVLAVRNSNFLVNEDAIFLNQAQYDLVNILFAWNTGATITGIAASGTSSYHLSWQNAVGETGVTSTDPATAAEPGFMDWTDDGDCANDLLFPVLGGPLENTGSLSIVDLDGSRSDIGAFGGPDADPAAWADGDADGFRIYRDCDDGDDTIHPGADEYCDAVDHDCDGRTDDPESIDATTWYADSDRDCYGDFNDPGTVACPMCDPYLDCSQCGAVLDSTDCDDGDPLIHPNADELCYDGVGVDSDCDGDPSAGAIDAGMWTQDLDGDGFGDDATLVASCGAPGPNWVVSSGGDCDDTDDQVHPGATDICDGVDQNCSGDESDVAGWQPWYSDVDGDGYGNPNQTQGACQQPGGYVANGDDCNDTNVNQNPDVDEVCDALDDDCNGVVDDGSPQVTWYADNDGDGFGDGTQSLVAFCPPASSWLTVDGDCDDSRDNVNPDAPEVCDGRDNDCDGDVDLDDADITDAVSGYVDVDGDGYGWGDLVVSCDGTGLVPEDGDCSDSIPAINPGAREVPGNGVDEDCDGVAEEGETSTTPTSSEQKTTGCACDQGAPSVPTFLALFLPILALRRRETETVR